MTKTQNRIHTIAQAILSLLIVYIVWLWLDDENRDPVWLLSPLCVLVSVLALSLYYKYRNRRTMKIAPGFLGYSAGAVIVSVPLISGVIVFLYLFIQ